MFSYPVIPYPMPEPVSTWASQVDWINALISDISLFCIFGITGVMVYLAVRYRRRSDHQPTAYITHNATIETVWTVVPTLVVIYLFSYGFVVYREMRTPPANALEINVDAYKWRWEFQHSNGKKATTELVVPLGRPVRLIMKSHDVIHSFFVPALRVKEDVVGHIYTYLWFTPTKLGEYQIFCAEYCGEGHSAMLGSLKVVSPEQYDDYVLDRTAVELAPFDFGKKLFTEKACLTCHSTDGSPAIGPTLKGLFGRKENLEDGNTVVVDENYLRESILNPEAKIVRGFTQTKMPQFPGISDKEIAGLIAYMKTLS